MVLRRLWTWIRERRQTDVLSAVLAVVASAISSDLDAISARRLLATESILPILMSSGSTINKLYSQKEITRKHIISRVTYSGQPNPKEDIQHEASYYHTNRNPKKIQLSYVNFRRFNQPLRSMRTLRTYWLFHITPIDCGPSSFEGILSPSTKTAVSIFDYFNFPSGALILNHDQSRIYEIKMSSNWFLSRHISAMIHDKFRALTLRRTSISGFHWPLPYH